MKKYLKFCKKDCIIYIFKNGIEFPIETVKIFIKY